MQINDIDKLSCFWFERKTEINEILVFVVMNVQQTTSSDNVCIAKVNRIFNS